MFFNKLLYNYRKQIIKFENIKKKHNITDQNKTKLNNKTPKYKKKIKKKKKPQKPKRFADKNRKEYFAHFFFKFSMYRNHISVQQKQINTYVWF